VTKHRFGASRRNGGWYDLAVIGAGSAGFSAAITATEQGAQVALIGHGTIGGTCTNIGCIPSKTLIRAAETLHNARVAARFAGIAAQAEVTNWRATIRQKNALVAELRQAKYIDLLPAYNGIHYREGAARLADGGVQVDGTRISAGKIIIATGARPAIPTIPGIETVPVPHEYDGARSRGTAEVTAGDRRRLHRSGTGPDVCARWG
jgi:pyruvate/2-oxoglutarate dehydrogenase complex dihydrolipoamide dehydrogenase (E3) component